MGAQRFRFSTGYKIALCIAGLLIAWRGLQDPFVVEVILTFGLTGQLPGTSVVLSPDTVIWLSFSLVVIVIGLALLRLRGRRSHSVDAITRSAMSAPQSPAIALVRPTLHNHVVTPRPALPLVPHSTWIGRLGSQARHKLRATKGIVPYIMWSRAYAGWVLRRGVQLAGQYAHAVAVSAIKYLRAAWVWIAPYLWKFDAWLGAWFHYGMRKTHRKMQSNDTTSVMLDFFRHGKRSLQDFTSRRRD